MRVGLLTACVLSLVAAGLVSAPAPAPAAAAAAPAGNDAQFFAELGFKDVATAADTARALTLLASEGKEAAADFETCRTYLRSRGILPDGWLDKAKADDPTDRGHLATLICRTLGIQGGLWMRLLGPQPHLALRECAYLELMITGCDYSNVAGGELVGVIDRCDRFRQKQAAEAAAPKNQPAPPRRVFDAEVKK